jgi:hypothetical protein
MLSLEEIAKAQAEGAAEKAQAKAAVEAAKPPPLAPRAQQELALYDASGRMVQLEPDAALKAVDSGSALPQPEALVNVIGPKGERGAVLGSNLQDVVRKGYRLETSREKKVNDYLDANAGVSGALKVGAAKAASEAALGVPELAYEKTAAPEDVAAWEALKEEHPYASATGAGLGFGASLFTGAPLFQGAAKAGKVAEGAVMAGKAAAEAGIARKVLAGAARMGVEGAAISAPQVITEASLGDPQEAAEHLAWGLGGGAVLGAAGAATSGAMRGLKKLATSTLEHYGVEAEAANPFKSLSETQAFRSLLHSQDEASVKLAQRLPGGVKGLGRYVLDENLLRTSGESFEKYATKITERKEAVGQEIGSIYQALDSGGAVGASAEDIAERLQKEVIDPLKRNSTKANTVNNLERYKEDFLQAARIQRDARWPAVAGLEQAGLEGAAVNENKPGQALYDLWETRKGLQSAIYAENKAVARGGQLPVMAEELDKFRNILNEEIEKAAAGKLPDGRSFKAEVDALNGQYQRLSTLEDIVERSALKEAKNRNRSLSDYLAGLAGHGAAGAVAGHGAAVLSPVAAVSGLVAMEAHHYIKENGNQLVAKYADKLGTYFAHQAAEQGEKEFARIPQILAGAKEKAESASLNAFHLFLGPGSEKKSDEDNLKTVSTKLADLEANPRYAQAHVAEIADLLTRGGAPQVGAAYAQAEANRAKWLLSQLPRPPEPKPFQKDEWKPSPREVREFKDKLLVAISPTAPIRELAKGTLTPAHMAAERAMWPASYDRMVRDVQMWGMTPQAKKVPYRKRLQLSLFMGAPLHGSMARISEFQANFGPAPQENPSGGAKLKGLPGSEYTEQQRLLT